VGLGLLILASLLVFGRMERWQPVGGQLLANAGLETDGRGLPAGWKVHGDRSGVRVTDGTLVLSKPGLRGLLGVEQVIALPAGRRAFRIEATVAFDNVRAAPDASPWHRALIATVGLGADGNADANGPAYLVRRLGTHRPQTYVGVHRLAEDTVAVALKLRLARVSGSMEVRNLLVVPVTPRPAYRAAALGLGAIWLLVGSIASLRLVRSSRRPAAAVGLVVTLAAALALSLLPHDATGPFYGFLHRPLRDVVSLDAVDLAVHVLGFALLALLWRLARPDDDLRLYVLLLAGVAIGGELVQGFAAGLGADDLLDAAANLAGATLGAAIALPLVRRLARSD
jgi:hypothetical protein